eukprot:6608381-Prymnesium_polylepis.1
MAIEMAAVWWPKGTRAWRVHAVGGAVGARGVLHLVRAPEQRHNRRRDAAKGLARDHRDDGVLPCEGHAVCVGP